MTETSAGAARETMALSLVVVLAIGYTAEAVSGYRVAVSPGSGVVQPLPTFLIYEDGAYYRAAILSMLHDGDLDLRNNFEALGNDPQMSVALGLHGEWYPKHPILLPLLSLPFYLAGAEAGLLAFNVAQVTMLGLLIWLCARRQASDEVAAAVAILYGFGTLLRPMAYHFSPDVLAAVLFLTGYLALVTRRPAVAGLLAGLAVWAKLPHLVLLPISGLYCLLVLGPRNALRFAAGASGPLLVIAGLDAHMFGSPFVTGYDRVIARIVNGVPELMASHRTFFDVPFWSGLARQVFDRRIGVLVSAPVIVLGAVGLLPLWRRNRPEALLVSAIVAAQLAFFARYRYWNVTNTGHRFVLIAIAVSAIPTAALLGMMLDREETAG